MKDSEKGEGKALIEDSRSVHSQMAEVLVDGTTSGVAVDHGREAESAPKKRSTLLKAHIEEAVRKENPELMKKLESNSGVFLQIGLVVVILLLVIYEKVFSEKGRAAGNEHPDAKYESAILGIWVAVLGIVVGLVLAACKGTLGLVFCKDAFPMLRDFTLPGFCFGASAFLGQEAQRLGMGASTKGTLDQTRLPCTAIAGYIFFKRKCSRSTWNILVTITILCIIYPWVEGMVRKEWENEHKPRTDTLAKIKGAADKKSDEEEADWGAQTIGFVFQAVSVMLMSAGGVLAEKFLKAYKKTPFYIQKVFIEIPALIICFILLGVNMTMKYVKGEKQKPMFTVHNWFGVWIDFPIQPFALGIVVLMFSKGFLQGVLVKRMDAMVKQLTQTAAVGLVYFFMLLHGCLELDKKTGLNQLDSHRIKKDGTIALQDEVFDGENGTVSTGTDFVCIDGISKNARSVMIALNLAVFCAVFGYALTNRDKARKAALKKQVADAEAAVEELRAKQMV